MITIGYMAFWNCVNLRSVEIPDSLLRIEDSAFSSCSSLKKINIPDSVEDIAEDAFLGCDNLADRELTAQIEDDRSREYWSGWILAYYQWYTGKSFKDIFERLPMSEVQRLYPTLHEASESKFVDVADKICFLEASDTKLKKIRKSSGYSQRELAEKSGVSIRMIQQYEIKAKDINKAAGETLMALSRVLGCTVEDLLEV